MKRALGMIMAVVLVVGLLTACSQPAAPAAEEVAPAAEEAAPAAEEVAPAAEGDTSNLRFAYACMTLENPWVVSTKTGFEEICEANGIEYLTVDAQYKVDKQVNDVESMIADGYDGIVIGPIDQNALADMVTKATDEGIAVVSIAQPIDVASGMVTLDEYKYGEVIAQNAVEWINSELGGKGKVAIISQDNVEAVIARGNGVEDTIKANCPDVEIVSRQAGDTPEKGMEIIESVLQQHPDLNVVVATNDSGGIGGYRAMKAAKAMGDDRAVFAGDAAAEALAAMQEEGSIYRATVDLFPYRGGKMAAEMLIKFCTQGIPAEQEIELLDMVPVWQADLADGTYVPEG